MCARNKVREALRAGGRSEDVERTVRCGEREAVAGSDWDKVKADVLALEATFPEKLRETEATLAQKFRDSNTTVLLAKIIGEVVGYALGGPLEDYKKVTRAMLEKT